MACDQEYFKATFFSGDQPSDLGQVKTPESLRFPNDDGFLFNHVRGKHLQMETRMYSEYAGTHKCLFAL